jgi:carbohydrate kinase (thermoresistant glucokinase family)
MVQLFVVMGVSGSGKTTVGRALAARLKCPFYDGDNFHPAENVAKMASGTPLNDADRAPWLARLAELLAKHEGKGGKRPYLPVRPLNKPTGNSCASARRCSLSTWRAAST